ncbi:zinc knuckle CX2CX4HX4C containing protein [Tanacetum coccineum]
MTKRNVRIPVKFDDSMHSINNTKNKNKKIASKNNGSSAVEQPMESDDVRNEGKGFVSRNFDEDECSVQGINMSSVEREVSGKKEINADRKSFIEAVFGSLNVTDRSLECIPIELDDNGVEVVVFDEIMVAEGSKRWELTLCGFFVGYKMSVNELRYNLRRMWSRFGFKDIVDYNNGLDCTELDKVPLWVRLCNIPIEAWTAKGISVIASRVGKPLVMDAVTASKCKQGIGLVRFTRVLIEVNAKKELAETVEIVYKDSKGEVQCRKNVRVAYDWKPPIFNTCGVFGHADSCCPKKEPIIVNSGNNVKEHHSEQKEDQDINTKENNNEGFEEVRNKKKVGVDNKDRNQNFKANPQINRPGNNVKSVYQAKRKEHEEKVQTHVKSNNTTEEKNGPNISANAEGKSGQSKKQWSIHKDLIDAMKRSANKFTVLEMFDVNEQNELKEIKNMKIVDEFLRKQVDPCENDMRDWDLDMIAYFKKKKELLVDK